MPRIVIMKKIGSHVWTDTVQYFGGFGFGWFLVLVLVGLFCLSKEFLGRKVTFFGGGVFLLFLMLSCV